MAPSAALLLTDRRCPRGSFPYYCLYITVENEALAAISSFELESISKSLAYLNWVFFQTCSIVVAPPRRVLLYLPSSDDVD